MNPLTTIADNLERERSRWPLWLPLALAIGIVAYFSLPSEPPSIILALTPILAALAWFTRHVSWRAAIVLFIATTISTGFSAAKIETLLDKRPMLEAPLPMLPITGRVASIDILPDGLRLTLLHPIIGSLAPSETPEKIRVKFNELGLEDAPPTGAEVRFKGMLNGFSEPVAPGATNFRRHAYFQHLGGLGWSRDAIAIVNPAPNDYTWSERFSLALESARKTLAHHVYARLSGDIAAITAAKLNGEQTGISSPVMEAMRTAGLAHLLATSGANVTIMGLLIYFPLRALLAFFPYVALRYPIKKWAAIAAVLSALGFTFLVGSQAATGRSMILVALAMAAIMLDRQTNALRLVMISALLSMIFAPSATMGASFQMSFFAVFCLIAANPGMSFKDDPPGSLMNRLPTGLRSTAAIVRTSLIATAATAPFTIYHFQSFNAYGFLSNVLAIPITSFWIMPFTLLAYITAPWSLDGFFIDMAGLGNALTIRIATTIASWPRAVIHFPAMPGTALIAIVIGGLWLCIWRQKWRIWGLIPILLALLYPLYTTEPDFLVSPTGKSWAARLDDGRFAVSNAKREKFVLSQWQQRLANIPIIDASALPSDHPQIRCDDLGCTYRRKDTLIAMPIKEIAALEDCAKADIVIAPFVVADCAAKVIDLAALKEHGAHTIFFDTPKPRIAYARKTEGTRPWSIGRKSESMKEQTDD